MLISEITMTQFSQGLERTRTIILPFGSIEEHGHHLPLGTDTLQMFSLALEASKVYPLFVSPPIYYGLCRSTRQHPGTITLRGETLKALALDLLSSYYQQGLRHFLILSGHAGGTHMAYLTDAGEEFIYQYKEAKVAVASILDLLRQAALDILETPDDSHAGEFETSLMLHFYPHLVQGSSAREYPSFPRPILVRNKRRFWPGGVWGDPSRASADKGQRFKERLVKGMVSLAQRLETFAEASDEI